jgi:hypothetical protein
MIPEVVQVFPQANYSVYIYFADGKIKLFDMKPLIGKGVFTQLSAPEQFIELCTVINHTLAWDIGGNFDPYRCIDIDPVTIYETGVDVEDPLVTPA